LVLPITSAPAALRRATTVASVSGVKAKAGQAAVVGMPATSILSFTAKGMPQSGLVAGSKAPSALASASTDAFSARWMKIPGSSAASSRAKTVSTTFSADRRPAA
jgi:hypothetical protein